jgi:hypothetical protein
MAARGLGSTSSRLLLVATIVWVGAHSVGPARPAPVEMPAPILASNRRKLVAIATTVWVRTDEARGINHDDVCGIVKWCRDASRFASALPILVARAGGSEGWDGRADVLVSTNDVRFSRSECPQPRIVHRQVEPSFMRLATEFAARAFDRQAAKRKIAPTGVRYHLSHEAFDKALLVKWALVSLVEYEMVLALDNDIDLFEVGRRSASGVDAYLANAARVWAEEVPRFRASSARLLGTPDQESPTNMGMVWLKPSTAYYEEGVALLRTMRFSVELGFNMSGRPVDLMGPEMARSRPMNLTRLVYLNSWNIVAGSSDQGLFTLVFVMRHRALQLTRRDELLVHHFWSSSKPWVRKGSCLPYFHQLGIVDAPGDESGRVVPPALLPEQPERQAGHCWPLMRRMAAKLVSYESPSLRKNWRCRGASFRLF